jgi:hypothetical protein
MRHVCDEVTHTYGLHEPWKAHHDVAIQTRDVGCLLTDCSNHSLSECLDNDLLLLAVMLCEAASLFCSLLFSWSAVLALAFVVAIS